MHLAIHDMISPDLACTFQGITDLFYPTHLDLLLFDSANIPACYLCYIDLSFCNPSESVFAYRLFQYCLIRYKGSFGGCTIQGFELGIQWTGWDLNPRPPTFPLPHQCCMQGRYSTGLNYRPTKLCPKDDNLSVLNRGLF